MLGFQSFIRFFASFCIGQISRTVLAVTGMKGLSIFPPLSQCIGINCIMR